MALRSVCRGTVRQSLPSSRIAPALVSVNRSSAATRLLLPAPAVVQVRLGPDGHCCSKRRKGKKGKERKGKERKGKERTTPFGVNFKRSQVSHRAAQIQMVIVAAWRWM